MLVHYYGHVGQGTGYAIAAEQTCRALIASGVDLEIIPMEEVNPPEDLARYVRHWKWVDTLTAHPDVVIIHTLPLDIGKVRERIASAYRAEICITYTVWEVYTCPTKIAQDLVDGCDILWVPSKETRRTITAALPAPRMYSRVRVVPHACAGDAEEAVDVKVHDGSDRPYRFYYVGAWTSRKNPTGLLRAFCHEFARADNVELRIHSYGASEQAIAAAIGHMGIQQADLPRLSFSTQRLTDEQLANLHTWGDCFVTATRGEGWNLPCFDAMRRGNMIVTPGSLGSDDYLWGIHDVCPPTSALIVQNRPQPAMLDIVQTAGIGKQIGVRVIGAQGVDVRQCWLDPDLRDLGARMRTAAERRDLLTVNYNPVAQFGYTAVGKLLAAEINSY